MATQTSPLSIILGIFCGCWALVATGLMVAALWLNLGYLCLRLRPSAAPVTNVRGCWQRIANIGRCRGVDDESMHLKIEALADAHRLRRVHNFLPLGALFLPLTAFRSLWTAALLMSGEENASVIFGSRYCFSFLMEFHGLLMILRPAKFLSKVMLQIGYTLVVVSGLYDLIVTENGKAAGSSDGAVLPEYRLFLDHALRLWFALLIQDSPFVFIVHVVVVPATLVVLAISGDQHLAQRCVAEILLAFLVCVASASLERATKASIHASLQAKSSKAFEHAAESLLASMCDAVVHLSKSFDFAKDCPRFSALLLRDPSTPLRDNFYNFLMSESDQQAFAHFIQADEADEGDEILARTIHVTLRDSNSMPVLVQLFHTRCCRMTGDEVHVVGVKDVGGERYQPMPAAARDVVKPVSSCSLIPISEDFASVSDGDSVSALQLDSAEDVKVWINTLELDMPMLRWTPAFVNIVGPSAVSSGEAKLMDFLASPNEQRRVAQKLQHLTNDLAHSTTAPSKGMQFAMSTRHLGDIIIDALVRLDWGKGEQEEEFLAVLEFKSWCHLKTRSSGRTRAASFQPFRRTAATSASADLVAPASQSEAVLARPTLVSL